MEREQGSRGADLATRRAEGAAEVEATRPHVARGEGTALAS